MSLTDIKILNAEQRDKEYKLADGGGLYVLIRPNGSKLWKLKLPIHGREQKLSFGRYPEISLKEARSRRDEAKLEMARGGDPVQRRRQEKQAAQLRAGNRFEEVAEEFIAKREAEGLAPATIKKAKWFLDLLRGGIGKRPIAEITPQDLLLVLRKATVWHEGGRLCFCAGDCHIDDAKIYFVAYQPLCSLGSGSEPVGHVLRFRAVTP